MIFFNTRHKLKEIQKELEIVASTQRSFGTMYNGTIKLVDEMTKHLYEHSAEKRKYEGMTFKAEQFFLEPEYGADWKLEEDKLNKKGKK